MKLGDPNYVRELAERAGGRLASAVRRVRRGGSNAPARSTARVATDRPDRYGKQLATHMSRRHGGEWIPESGSGWMQLGSGKATVTAETNTLVLEVTASDPGEIEGLESVVGRHLAKFGAKDGLVVSWVRSDGSPGTES